MASSKASGKNLELKTEGKSHRLSMEVNPKDLAREAKKAEEKSKKDATSDIDKKLMGPGGKEALRSLTPKEIDRKFKQLLGNMGVKDSSNMKDKYTHEQKITLIEAVLDQQAEAIETPESFVKSLQSLHSISLDTLDKLADKLQDSEWVSTFIANDGCVALMEALLFCLFKTK
jgi:hypothetical protein